MISVSTLTANTAGTLIFEELPNSELKTALARVTQVPTLDGESIVTHQGFSHGDRNMTIEAFLNETDADVMWNIFTTESLIYLSTSEGFFKAAISNFAITKGRIKMTFAIKEKMN
jgi:hypothetical protein